jgi:hypothetical protein
MDTPRTLTLDLAEASTPDNLRGKVEGALGSLLAPATAASYAAKLVDEAGFDTPDVLLELSEANLVEMGIPCGHRGRLRRALFNEPAAAGVVPVAAAPPINVTVAAPTAPVSKWKLEWPDSATPESILDWGMTIRANLIKRDGTFAQLVWGRFTKSWNDIAPADHTDGNDLDIYLSKALLSIKVPDWAAPLVRNPLQQWHAVLALQAVCRQVFVRTDLSDKELKRRVRYPDAVTRSGDVSLRLATWDSDVSVMVDVRNYPLDEHDSKEALKDVVEGLEVFEPVLEQFANRDSYTSAQQLRKRLGEVADGVKVSPTANSTNSRNSSKTKKKAHVAKEQRERSSRAASSDEKRAAKAIAAVSKAVGKAGGFSKPRPRKKGAPGLCRLFSQDGNCRFGDKCIFSHGRPPGVNPDVADENPYALLADIADSSERDQFMAAVARFWDGGNQPRLGMFLSVVRQAAQQRKTSTRSRMRHLLDALAVRKVAGSASGGLASPNSGSRAALSRQPISEGVRERVVKKVRKRSGRQSRPRVRPPRKPDDDVAAPMASSSAAAAVDKACDGDREEGEHFTGALPDTGASGSFIGNRDWELAVNKKGITPFTVQTGDGVVVVDEGGDLPFTGGLISGAPMLPGCPETLLSVGKTCLDFGCGYTQDPGNTGARFWHPQHGVEGEVELLPDADGVLFRLPALGSVPWAQGERKTALGSLTALMASNSPAWYQGHCERGHPFRPDCDSCVRGRLRQRQAKRKEAAGKIRSLGYVMSADFTGKTEMDLDGHTVAIVCCVHGYTDEEPLAREAAYGFVSLLVKRDTDSVAEALDAFDNELAQLGRDKSRTIVRFQTDVDKSFLGKVKKMACRKGWSQTDTGGYRSQANGIVERRIGMLKQGVRTVLLAATGATYYYDQLWGHGLMYVNYCTNRNDWSDTLAPFTQLTGKVYIMFPRRTDRVNINNLESSGCGCERNRLPRIQLSLCRSSGARSRRRGYCRKLLLLRLSRCTRACTL